MNSDKKGAIHLCAVLKAKGIRHIVICPGSRNAPLIISFTSDPFFKCYSIVDERSAGFFALGLSQTEKHSVAIVCTSGSALLNIGPAVVEAFYQRLPLIVISADRPKELLGQGESQTMDQKEVFKNFTRAGVDLIQEPKGAEDLKIHDEQIIKTIDQGIYPNFGPVHINIRFQEPLYGKSTELLELSIPNTSDKKIEIDEKLLVELKDKWDSSDRIMIICGQMPKNPDLQSRLEKIADHRIVILTESTSNLSSEKFIPFIDKIVIPSSPEEKKKLKPTLLLTIGGPLISRKIKTYLRQEDNFEHWHIDELDPKIDAYHHLSHGIKANANDFLKEFEDLQRKKPDFLDFWSEFKNHVEEKGNEFVTEAKFSDLKAFDFILDKIPSNYQIHVGNSSSIRYAQLFNKKRDLVNFSNRGISGIDGSVSTALGSSVNSTDNTILITGDLSMLYDSNALWNNYLSPKFKIVVINNGGGGIFKIIEGPKSVEKFEEFIETTHQKDFNKLADLHDLAFYRASDMKSLNDSWNSFMTESNKTALLEVNTIGINNEEVLMNFFNHLIKQ